MHIHTNCEKVDEEIVHEPHYWRPSNWQYLPRRERIRFCDGYPRKEG